MQEKATLLDMIIRLPASRNHLMIFWVILAMDQSEAEMRGPKEKKTF